MKKLLSIALICSIITGFVYAETFGAAMPSGPGTKVEDFEDGFVWIHAGADWDRWGDHHVSCGAELARKWKTTGRYSLMVSYDRVYEGDNSMWYTDYEDSDLLDLSPYSYITMDVYNPNDYPLVLGLTGLDKEWKWLQSETWCWFPKGEHTLVFDITTIPLEQKKNIKRLQLLQAITTPDEGYFYIDTIRGYK